MTEHGDTKISGMLQLLVTSYSLAELLSRFISTDCGLFKTS